MSQPSKKCDASQTVLNSPNKHARPGDVTQELKCRAHQCYQRVTLTRPETAMVFIAIAVTMWTAREQSSCHQPLIIANYLPFFGGFLATTVKNCNISGDIINKVMVRTLTPITLTRGQETSAYTLDECACPIASELYSWLTLVKWPYPFHSG